jgi:hypothetical protein
MISPVFDELCYSSLESHSEFRITLATRFRRWRGLATESCLDWNRTSGSKVCFRVVPKDTFPNSGGTNEPLYFLT